MMQFFPGLKGGAKFNRRYAANNAFPANINRHYAANNASR